MHYVAAVAVLMLAAIFSLYSSVGTVSAYTNTTNVTHFVTVTATCGLVTNSSTLDFGSVTVGVDSTTVYLQINNTGSTVATTVNATGTVWYNSTANFPVTQSHFNLSTADINWGESSALTTAGLNVSNITNGVSITVAWEVNVPLGTAAQVYRQNVTYSSLC
jgi:hypothetical protein